MIEANNFLYFFQQNFRPRHNSMLIQKFIIIYHRNLHAKFYYLFNHIKKILY